MWVPKRDTQEVQCKSEKGSTLEHNSTNRKYDFNKNKGKITERGKREPREQEPREQKPREQESSEQEPR